MSGLNPLIAEILNDFFGPVVEFARGEQRATLQQRRDMDLLKIADGLEAFDCPNCGRGNMAPARSSDRQPHGEVIESDAWRCDACGAIEDTAPDAFGDAVMATTRAVGHEVPWTPLPREQDDEEPLENAYYGDMYEQKEEGNEL